MKCQNYLQFETEELALKKPRGGWRRDTDVINFFPLWQQSLAIGAVLLNDRVVAAAVHVALGIPSTPSTAWLSPVVAMACWPPVFLLLDALRLGHWRRG